MTKLAAVAGALTTFLAASLAAQDDPAPAAEQVRAALAKTRRLAAIAFKSIESQDEAMLRDLPIPPRDDVEVTGRVVGGVLHAAVGYDDDQVVLADGRMLARRQDGAWKLRRGCLADGRPLPFVLDPAVVLGLLADLPAAALQVRHSEAGKANGKDVVIHGLTFTGAVADELTMSGFLPRPHGARQLVQIGGGGEALPRPEITLDVAVAIDPASGFVVRLHSKAYVKSNLPGHIRVQVAGGAEFDSADAEGEEDEADDTKAEEASLQFSKGLPKRKLGKKVSLTEFDIVLTEHGVAKPIELPEAARALLGRQ